jgi:SAM-dependent methyltransferase
MSDSDWLELNRALWDERVPIHVTGDFYDVEGFLAGRSSVRPFELDELGEVTGCSLVHPQCHFGQDTLSWARHGARVTGLDFSAPAIEAARSLAEQAGLEAEFIQANIYDAVAALGGRRFDVVYTGLGALNWLPDIERWASTMASLLATGGRFYLVELHPITEVFAEDSLEVTESYFDPGPHAYDEPGTYADPSAPTKQNRSIEWRHPLGEVVSAIISAGLRLEFLHEHPYTESLRWPFLERDADRIYRMPAGRPELPLMYSLRATRPD